MVQCNCHRCVWTNSLLCSLYWEELLKHALRNETLSCWRPQCSIWSIAGCSSRNFHALPVADLLFLYLQNCFVNQSAELCYCQKHQCNHSRPSAESGLPWSDRKNQSGFFCTLWRKKSLNILSITLLTHLHSQVSSLQPKETKVICLEQGCLQPQCVPGTAGQTDHNSHQTMAVGCGATFPYIPAKPSALRFYKRQKQSLYVHAGDLGPQGSLVLRAG